MLPEIPICRFRPLRAFALSRGPSMYREDHKISPEHLPCDACLKQVSCQLGPCRELHTAHSAIGVARPRSVWGPRADT